MSEAAALPGFDVRRIMALLPHRYPMLLVDRIVSYVPDTSIHAVKAVSINEPFFAGHFPTRPIMPGVLIVEALAQAAGVLAIESMGLADANNSGSAGANNSGSAGGGKLVYFMAIENAKFRKPVEPGCLLDLHVSIVQAKRNICKFEGRALIDGALAAECSFTAMIADPPAG